MSTSIRLVLPGGRRPSRLTRFVGYSLGAHLALYAALVLAPQLRDRAPMPMNAWAVELVAASPPPAASPPSRAASTPPVVEREEPPASKPEPIVKQPPTTPTPTPERVGVDVTSRRRPRPTPSRPDPTPPAPSNPAPGAPSGSTGPVGSGDESASVTALEVADFRYAWYRDAVTAALYGNWRKPVLAGSVGPREVRVAFEIARDGSVSRVRIESPSGVSTLDRSALRAVADAAPFPPLPAGWGSASLPAAFVFRLYPD